ncbi:type IV conjugative transfer system pilin TraA, partial [Klebsiella aerogenes]|uniref:type IV conjugative transfer system pilin TraA n=1 Tax=Klebsiella aerogenes TaxID=548 RepID=UPI0028DEED22
MTTALSIQSAEMSKSVKPSRTRLFSKTKMLKAAKAVLPVAVLAAAFPEVAMATTTGTDLMKSGDGTVKATFGKGSS